MITVGELIHKLQKLDEDMQVSYKIVVYTDNEALIRNSKAYEKDFTTADEWSRIQQECERIHK